MKNEILIIILLTTIACSSIGSFLVLRKMSMITDAISHTVLLGIILAFLLTKSLNSPLLIIFAGVFGVITVMSVELLTKTKKLRKDASIGIVFPLFFAIAILLVTMFSSNIHIDKDAVLFGQVVLAPLNKITIFGMKWTYSMIVMFVMCVVNILFIVLFYKQLKVSTFDSEYSFLIGVNNVILNYLLMSIVSTTAVAAFDVVGAILVISLMIVPPASAYIITKRLYSMILLSVFIGMLNAFIGFQIAYQYNLSIAGTIAFVNGISFTLIAFFAPKQGVLFKYGLKRLKIKQFEQDLMLMHIFNHEKNFDELGAETINFHLNWNKKKLEKHITILTKNEMIYRNDTMYHLTTKGKRYIEKLKNNS